MQVQSLSHIGICVSDLERSVTFYREVLGFEERARNHYAGEPSASLLGLEGASFSVVYLDAHDVRIELLHYDAPGHQGKDEPRPMNQLGVTHFSFRVQGLDRLLERLQEYGGRVLESTRGGSPDGSHQALFAVDPDGTRLELIQAPGDPKAIPGSSAN